MPIKVRVGQTDAIKILSSAGGGSIQARDATNVIGGIASVTSLTVSGISTLSGNLNLLDNLIGDGATNISGINSVTATSFFGDGSGLQNTGATLSPASGSQRLVVTSLTSGTMTTAATDADLSFNATSNLLSAGKLIIAGISTFDGNIDANANLDVDGHTELDDVNISGVSTFSDDVVFTGANTNARWDHSTSDLILFDNTRLEFGSNKDFEIWHGGAHTNLKNSGGDLRIRGDKILLKRADDTERYLEANVNQGVKLFFNGVERFETISTGATVIGDLYVGGDLFINDDITFDEINGRSLNISGISTFQEDVEFKKNVSIGGTLTYEDVTNVDSVGLVTARSGIRVIAGGLLVSSGISTFLGGLVANTAKITDLTSGRLVLAGVGGELEDSGNLTFNGSLLTVSGNQTVTGTLNAGLIDGGVF